MRFLKRLISLRLILIGFIRSLSSRSIVNPKWTLSIAVLITCFAALGIQWLKLRTDGRSLVSQNAPEVIYDQKVRDQFGIEDQIVVLIRSDRVNGIFNPSTLQFVRQLTAKFKNLSGINPDHVISLATEPSFRLRANPRVPQTLLEPPVATQPELDQFRRDLDKIKIYAGTLVSDDGKSTVILIGTPKSGDNARLYQRVLDVIRLTPSPSDTVKVTGAPVAEALFGIHILEDLGVPGSLLGITTKSNTEQQVGRMPATFYELRLYFVRRIGLLPTAIVVMMLVFFLYFRNVLATLLPLPGVAATLLFVFGLMGWCGVPIYLTIAIVPILLTTIGVTNDIYLFNRYFTLLRQKSGGDHVVLIRETFEKLASPVASTSLTAGIGLMSFCFSPLAPVKAFGAVGGLGVLFGMFYSLTVIPALLTLIPPAWVTPRKRRGVDANFQPGQWFARLGSGVIRNRWQVFGLLLILVALTPIGFRRLKIQDSWMDGFDPKSEFRQMTQTVNEHFDGMHLLFVSFDAHKVLRGEIPAKPVVPGRIVLPGELVDDPGQLTGASISIFPADAKSQVVWQTHVEEATRMETNIIIRVSREASNAVARQILTGNTRLRFEVTRQSHLSPEVIRATGELGAFIRMHHQNAVGGVLSPADYLMTTRFMLQPENPAARGLPDNAIETKLLWDFFQVANGPQRLHQIVSQDYSQSLTTVFLKDANFVDTAELMKSIRDYEQQHLAPQGIRLGFAGDVALSQSLIEGIVSTQMQSLLWSLAGIFLVTSWLGGSLRWGVYCVAPSLMAVVIKFAIMGWLDIPLGVATSMFAATTLGIGVSCAIHLLEGYHQAVANGVSSANAVVESLRLTGPPAFVNTIAISLGFSVLMLSQVPANARLGLLLVVGLVNCFIASLLVLPVLLNWRPVK